MAAIAVSAVRQRVAAAIASALGTTWQEASDPYDQFGAGDGDRLHQSYAVGAPTTVTLGNDRQVLARGVPSETAIRIRWAYNLSALDQVASYDAGLDSEQLLLATVMAIHQGIDLHLLFASSSRSVDDQGWMMGDITVRALHNMPLA